ncbi:MAG: CBS domain-containing protein [Proteobacteria bacterium]|nr:CBS domain-containing protein [Pseudomonadota bacterium]
MERAKVPTARDIMTRTLTTLRPDMPAVDAAELLLKNAISGAPVVDSSGNLLGLLSEFDCLRAVAASDYEMDAHDLAEVVGDLMTRDCHTVSPELDLFGLAHEFVRLHVRRLPVVENGRLLGQVSRRDALRAAVELRRARIARRSDFRAYPEGRDPIPNYPR